MTIMTPKLSPDVRLAVEQGHGSAEFEVDGEKFIVMSQDVYMQMLGLTSPEQLAASAAEVASRIESAKKGPNRPFRDVLNELGNDA